MRILFSVRIRIELCHRGASEPRRFLGGEQFSDSVRGKNITVLRFIA